MGSWEEGRREGGRGGEKRRKKENMLSDYVKIYWVSQNKFTIWNVPKPLSCIHSKVTGVVCELYAKKNVSV